MHCMELTIHVENHYNFDDDMLNNGRSTYTNVFVGMHATKMYLKQSICFTSGLMLIYFKLHLINEFVPTILLCYSANCL